MEPLFLADNDSPDFDRMGVAGALSGLRRFGGGICPAATAFPVGTGINSSVMLFCLVLSWLGGSL